MATRQELGAILTKEMADLNDDIFNRHRSYAGTTTIGESTMSSVHEACARFQERLATIRGSAEEYLALAPEMRQQFNHDVWQLESAIGDFRRSVSNVYDSTKSRNRELDDPLRPTGGGFARRTGPNQLTTVQDSVVPIIRHVASGFLGLGTTPVVVGHARQKVVRTFDSRGRPTGVTIYRQ